MLTGIACWCSKASSEVQAQQTAAAEAISAHPLGNEVGIESKRPLTGSAAADVEADWNELAITAAHVYPNCMTRSGQASLDR
jgi:hypothetical protein